MWRLFYLLVLVAHSSCFSIVCYYTNWAQYRPGKGKYLPENVDPNLCTIISYAFCNLTGLNIHTFEHNDEIMYKRIMKARDANSALKVYLAVGGYNMGSEPFVPVVSTDDNREQFARNSLEFIRHWDFDGFELDWEYPNATYKERFTLLTKKLRQVFEDDATKTGKPRLELGVALPAGKTNIDAGYEMAAISEHADIMNIMAYDLHGQWEAVLGINAPLYAHTDEEGTARFLNVDWMALYYVSLGVPKEKLNIGIGSYGRSFTLKNPAFHDVLNPADGPGKAMPYTRQEGIVSYYEICDLIKNGGEVVWVESQAVPYVFKGDQWIGYDNVQSVKQKACYIKNNGYNGVIFWTLDMDDFEGSSCYLGTYPLLRAVNKALFTPTECGTAGEGEAVTQKSVPRTGGSGGTACTTITIIKEATCPPPPRCAQASNNMLIDAISPGIFALLDMMLVWSVVHSIVH